MKISIILFVLFVAWCLISVEGFKPRQRKDDCKDNDNKGHDHSNEGKGHLKSNPKGKWKRSASEGGDGGSGGHGGGKGGGLFGLKLDDLLKLKLLQ